MGNQMQGSGGVGDMREILFRGQTRRYGEKVWMNGEKVPSNWVYGGIFLGCGDFSIIYTYDPVDKFPVYTDTVGQYTGLTDKNGKKIFEGDIVKCSHTVKFARKDKDYSKIRYSYGGDLIQTCPEELVSVFGTSYEYKYWRNYVVEYFRGIPRLHNKSCVNSISFSYIINHDIEVIGNIHDNPELLNGGADNE